MRFIARLLWIAAFILATYSWMVVFEHGVTPTSFKKGFKEEWRNVASLLMGKPPGPVQITPGTVPTPK